MRFESEIDMRGIKILYVHTEEGHSRQMYAIDHYALLAYKNGYNVAMLGPEVPHPDAVSIPSLGEYQALSRTGFAKLIQFFRRYISFISSVFRFKPDLIHVRNHVGATLLPPLLKIIRPRAKIVLDIRTLSPNRRKDNLFKRVRTLNTFLFDHVFGLNETILEAYTTHGNKTSKLPAGYDEELFFIKDRSLDVNNKSLRCLYYGSMNRVRSLDRLLSAVIYVLEQGHELYVDFVGEGGDKSRLESMVPIDYRNKIRFLPFQDQYSLSESLVNYDFGLAYVPNQVALAPNIPLKTIEMIAAGLPVLATKTPGNIDVVNYSLCGILVDDDVVSISDGLIRMVNSDLPRKPHSYACRDMVSCFSWKSLAGKYLFPVYVCLLGKKH